MKISPILMLTVSLAGTTSLWAERPNVLLILADDLGDGDVACYNPESKVPTPNIDRLAKEGIRFTDAHSPSTVCTPTRFSLLTGRMAFRTGMRGVFTGAGGPCMIEESRLTLPGMLQFRQRRLWIVVHPELVKELKTQLEHFKESGRSAPLC